MKMTGFASREMKAVNHSPESDDAVYMQLIQSLYGTPATVIVGTMIITTVIFSAYFLSKDPIFLFIGSISALVSFFRTISHIIYYRYGRNSTDRGTQQKYETLALLGAWLMAATVGCFGAYSVIAHTFQAASVLGVAQTMGYLAGVVGRNVSRPYITQAQMSLVSMPFIGGLLWTGEAAYIVIGVAVAFTLLATITSVHSIYSVFISRIQTMRKLEIQATTDALTGLANRPLILQKMQELHANAESFAVISVNIDNFKYINDVFGYEIGDQFLIETAKRIQVLCSGQNILARTGGNEFTLLVPGENPEHSLQIAHDVLAAISLPLVVRNLRLRATASAGISNEASMSPDEALKCSDLALFEAKSSGRNKVCVYLPKMREKFEERLSLEHDLRYAIENGEIQLAYQPIVDLKTRQTMMVEALMRWSHPSKGSISPAVFIPVAEATGQILLLGSWAMQMACHAATNWPAHIGICVNLSVKQFRADHDLVAIVQSCLESSGLAPERLTLEITESFLIEQPQLVIETLERLRKIGVRIALDDFGSGYSSLNYIAQLPLDKIKIDRTFTAFITTSQKSVSLMRGIVAIARDLSLEVIVEGVETEEQLEEIQSYGVDGIQGYVFARPMDVVSLIPYLLQRIKASNLWLPTIQLEKTSYRPPTLVKATSRM
ncbi:MAG: putative bifunctional diguanylate cyclase/phosphodiesterase [Rhabdaerophilum sp.]